MRAKQKLAELLRMHSAPAKYVPSEVSAAIREFNNVKEYGEKAMLTGDEQRKAEIEDALKQNEEVLAELQERSDTEGMVFRFKHVPTGTHEKIKDKAIKAKAKFLSSKSSEKENIKQIVLGEIGAETLDQLVGYHLDILGKGDSYLDENNFKTVGELLRASADRIFEERDRIEVFSSEDTFEKFDQFVRALAVDASLVGDDEFLRGFKVYLTEQEIEEIANSDEDQPEYDEEVAKKRQDAFKRHLKLEEERRLKEVARERERLEGRGREILENEIANRVLKLKADEEQERTYMAEMISEMTEEPADEYTEEYDGKWVKAFSASDVFELAVVMPDLYRWLVEQISYRLPGGVAEIVSTDSF